MKTNRPLSGLIRLILLLLAANLSALGAGEPAPAKDIDAANPAPAKDIDAAKPAPAKDTTYILRPNDSIRLAVYEEPDLSVQVRILKTGEASFPLIGPVKVGGLSVTAATKAIRDLYAKDYLVDPKLMVTVDEYATDFISVIGAVLHPGQIPMPVSGNLDLGAAIAIAGGLAPDADAGAIQLVRASGSTATFSMAGSEGASGRLKLSTGDRIIVNQSAFVDKTVTIFGPVAKTGQIPFPIDGQLTLVKAIGLAGGLTPLANPKKISINRRGKVMLVDFRAASQSGSSPILLQPDDIITVAERFF
ncbi:MAG: polysaccharide biosynthesis/export family protein [Akkermansiaceae bacterium]|nr:polysaccharide biosynthesis/export family protein [Akkermansiaceae bacterium]